jgi:hypothetical protein
MAGSDAQKMMDLVEEKTGYKVSISVDDTITTQASMISARSSLPMHVIKVKPQFEKYGDYLVAVQCAMLLIKWAEPARIPDFAILNSKMDYLQKKFAGQASAKGLPSDTAHQYASMIVAGILQQLNSTPIQILSMEMITELCPGLHLLQEESVKNEMREASDAFTPQIQKITPKEIFDRNASMNAAYAIKWSRLSGDTMALLPYQSLGYIKLGEKLIEEYESLSTKKNPDRYVETVDAWAKELRMETWYEWHYRKAE